MKKEKFKFPSKGFSIVATKAGEADFFFEQLKKTQGHYEEFSYALSAFVSATRSITFTLQSVMSKYPDFNSWYGPHQEALRSNNLAKYFVNLRNHMQKAGEAPIEHTGVMRNGRFINTSYFIDTDGLKNAPDGEVVRLARDYLVSVLIVIERCYRDFWAYVDPRAIFTEKGLSILGWSIEDLEEAVGLPRGWTDVPYKGDDKSVQRLRLLQREFMGDEMMEQYFSKYNIHQTSRD